MTIASYEAVAGDGWYLIAQKLGGSQANQAVKDTNALYLAQANGGTTLAEPLRPGRIVWYNTDKIIKTSAPSTQIVYLEDFAEEYAGDFFQADLLGPGMDLLEYRVRNSTKAAYVAGLADFASNLCVGMRAGNLSPRPRTIGQDLAGFTLDMSDVPHDCNGIQLAERDNGTVKGVRIRGARGSDSHPPGETFLMSAYRTVNELIEDSELDGRLRGQGATVGATLLGLNRAKGTVVRRLNCHHANAFGLAVWGSSGRHVFEDCKFTDCRKPVNHEQNIGHYEYLRPDVRRKLMTAAPHFTFATNLTDPANPGHPCTLRIINPLVDGQLIVAVLPVGAMFDGADGRGAQPNTARAEDVEVIIGDQTFRGPVNNAQVKIGNYYNG